jgi:hypothetical protein
MNPSTGFPKSSATVVAAPLVGAQSRFVWVVQLQLTVDGSSSTGKMSRSWNVPEA